MSLPLPIRQRIQKLKQQYDVLRIEKDSLLTILAEHEMAEGIYNSNAIENSTLTLKETEKILLEQELSRNVSIREMFEAKNLARVMSFVRAKVREEDISITQMVLLHEMLLTNIDDGIAGRFRQKNEYVRVGNHIAPAPEHVDRMIESVFLGYAVDLESYFLDKIAQFHLDFETVHPFNDGNGRIGRVIINYQLLRIGLPEVIIRNKEKHEYYEAFDSYREKQDTKPMELIVARALMEALHKRIAYLRNDQIIPLTAYAKQQGKPAPVILNAAKRQTIPAFRVRGAWKIGVGG